MTSLTEADIKNVMIMIDTRDGYAIADSGDFGQVFSELKNYFFKGEPIKYEYQVDNTVDFSKKVQRYIKSHYLSSKASKAKGKASKSKQCKAITAKGTQCSRNAVVGNRGLCNQHAK